MRQLAEISLDMWLLAQRAPSAPLPDGHLFQMSVADSLRRPGLLSAQRAGHTTLWGAAAASGTAHELDAAARAPNQMYLFEAKATAEISKGDLAVFEMKVTDYYFSRWKAVAQHAWYPFLCAAGAVSESCRRLAMHRSITLCDGARLPLPVLYHHATHPSTRDELPEDLCAEMARLAPRALVPLQERYVPRLQEGGLFIRPDSYAADDIDDLLYVQDALTDSVLHRYDQLAPGRLEARAARLQRRLVAVRAA